MNPGPRQVEAGRGGAEDRHAHDCADDGVGGRHRQALLDWGFRVLGFVRLRGYGLRSCRVYKKKQSQMRTANEARIIKEAAAMREAIIPARHAKGFRVQGLGFRVVCVSGRDVP